MIKAKYMVCGKQTYEGTMEVPNNYFDDWVLVLGEPPKEDKVLMDLLKKLSVRNEEIGY